jgi:mannitol-1-/sugar-/sorbitol-6-phosphatase
MWDRPCVWDKEGRIRTIFLHGDHPLIELSCEAILFDMDGTLVDSTLCDERIMGRWAEKHGLDREFVLQVYLGRRTIDAIREVAPHLNVEEEARGIDAQELVEREGITEVRGALHLLRKLKPHQWAIVTSASRALATFRLGCAGLPLPQLLVCGDDVTNGKPDPEGYLKAAHQLRVSPARCLVVEDTPAGILAGRSAGMNILALTTTYAKEKLLGATSIANFNGVDFHLER